jgi:long-chain acyl-CoA synthetase
MDKVWLKSYPPGIPAEIDPHEFSSIRDILEKSCAKFAGLPAFTCMDSTLTFTELDRLSRDFGSWLQNRAGLARGARVALMMPNTLQYPIALFGALRAGFVVVNCNPLYTPRELEHQLNDSGAEAIVILENFAHTLQQVVAKTAVKTIVTTQLGDMLRFPKSLIVNLMVKHVKKMVPAWSLPNAVAFRDALSEGARTPLKETPLGHDDLAFLQYTGGTTGVSKGAMLTHGNIVSNLLQSSSWTAQAMQDGGEIVITALPMYHIFALTGNCLAFLKRGAHNVLIVNPRDFPKFVAELAKYKFSAITGVNTLFNALMNTPGFAELDFSRLKFSLGGGMAVQRSVAERWKKVTGCPLLEAYGLTETSPGACINPLVANFEFNGTAGLPIPSTIITIRDDEGRILPPRRHGRDLHRRPAGDEGLLEAPRRDREGDDRRWGVSHRRHRPHDARGLREDRRPEEGHDPRLRLQRVPERGRGRDRDDARRARGLRRRRARREVRGGGPRRHRAQGPRAHQGAGARALQEGAHRLQAAADRGVLEGAAQVERGQGPAPRGEERAGPGRRDAKANAPRGPRGKPWRSSEAPFLIQGMNACAIVLRVW